MLYNPDQQKKYMKRYSIQIIIHLILIGFLFPVVVHAQEKPVNPFVEPKRVDHPWLFEGIIGFQFGTASIIEVSPTLGYHLTPTLIPGVSFTYQFSRFPDFYINTETNERYDLRINITGGRIFTRYLFSNWFDGLLGGLFAQAEFEYLSYMREFTLDASGKYVDRYGFPYSRGSETVRVPGFLIGGGLMQPVGENVFTNILVLYNINETRDTPYSNPVIRIGFGVGF